VPSIALKILRGYQVGEKPTRRIVWSTWRNGVVFSFFTRSVRFVHIPDACTREGPFAGSIPLRRRGLSILHGLPILALVLL